MKAFAIAGFALLLARSIAPAETVKLKLDGVA